MSRHVTGQRLILTGVIVIVSLTCRGESNLLELRLVSKIPTETAKAYPLPDRGGHSEQLLVEPEVLLNQSAVQVASPVRESDGSPEIELRLSQEGARRFGEITQRYQKRRLAIFINGRLQSAPVINQPILGGLVRISGNFTEKEADDLADKINQVASSGSLPDELKPV